MIVNVADMYTSPTQEKQTTTMDFVFHFNCSSAFVQFFCKILFVFNCILLTEFLYDVLSNNSTLALRGRKKEWFTFIVIEYYDNTTNRNKN